MEHQTTVRVEANGQLRLEYPTQRVLAFGGHIGDGLYTAQGYHNFCEHCDKFMQGNDHTCPHCGTEAL